MAKLKHKTLAERIDDQRQWIAEHGATEAGYIQRYGAADDPEHYGDGGEAIYAADLAALRALERQRPALIRAAPKPEIPMFKLEIETDNDAFARGNKPYELARILVDIAKLIHDGDRSGKVRDINGNTVGSWSF